MDRIVHQSARLRCDVTGAYEMFTESGLLESWLAAAAEVEPREGGKYELFWDPEHREKDSTIGCKITGIQPDTFLSFEWKGPANYERFMNTADPLTHVVVFFVGREGPRKGTEVHVIHSGWRSSTEWEEARQWFDRVWRVALEQLEHQVNTAQQEGDGGGAER
jgi:hypothetical protein